MLELIWRFQTPAVDDESVMLPLLTQIAQTPEFSAQRYDLNKKEQWRTFEVETAVVDALTQRTQLVRIQAAQSEAVAMIALGKHDEQPTAIIRLPDQTSLEDLVGRWTVLYEQLPVESTVISAARWRRELHSAGLAPDTTGDLLGMVFGWRRGHAPQAIDDVIGNHTRGTPIRLVPEINHRVLWLADRAAVDDEVHRRALKLVSRRLLGVGDGGRG